MAPTLYDASRLRSPKPLRAARRVSPSTATSPALYRMGTVRASPRRGAGLAAILTDRVVNRLAWEKVWGKSDSVSSSPPVTLRPTHLMPPPGERGAPPRAPPPPPVAQPPGAPPPASRPAGPTAAPARQVRSSQG